jgi:cytochrome P450
VGFRFDAVVGRLQVCVPAGLMDKRRTYAQADQRGGWQLPAGTVVNTSILLAHQRSDNYPDTWSYRPSRFLHNEVEPNTWLPFGGGVRRRIGAGFSLMEGTVVVREILTRYRLALPDGSEPERGRVRNITTVPRRRARVVVTARSG